MYESIKREGAATINDLKGKHRNYTGGKETMSTELERIAELIERYPNRRMQTIMHYVNKESLTKAHEKQKTGKASGIDKETKEKYEEELDKNIENLLERMKQFKYRPKPVRRTYIPKVGSDKKRPLGIPAYEDKLVQYVMTQILTEIYEPKFYEFSFGFREYRNCHEGLKYLRNCLMDKTGWVVDADIKGFFDNMNHEWMIKFLEHDIEDKVFLRYVKRFLNTGMMEEGKYIETDKGTPQGGVISPILANIYLHYVIDTWFEKKVKKECSGYCAMVRYADDNVFCFQYENDAKKFYKNLIERLGKFGLEIAEEKTKIIEFGRFSGKETETFDFLGFKVVKAKSKNGKYFPKFITSEKKLKVKRQTVKCWLKANMHMPIKELIRRTNLRLNGHYNYYGVSYNSKKLKGFCEYVKLQLFKILKRRSQKGKINWERFNKILKHYPIASPKIKVNLFA